MTVSTAATPAKAERRLPAFLSVAPEAPDATALELSAIAKGLRKSVAASARVEARPDTPEAGPGHDAATQDDRFAASWRAIGAHGDGAEVLGRLRELHREPARRFHTLQHVLETLDRLEAWAGHAERAHEIALALWFNHAFHDVARCDNEAKSGQLALESLMRHAAPADAARRVRDLIVCTRRDAPSPSRDGRLLLDIDAAILAAAPARFAQYEQQLREEHCHAPELIYRRKRLQTLKCLLARARLYGTDVAQRALDERARANLVQRIDQLGTRVP